MFPPFFRDVDDPGEMSRLLLYLRLCSSPDLHCQGWATSTLSSDPGFTTLRLVFMLTPSQLVSDGETRSQRGEEEDVTVVNTTQDNSGAI